jgi:hypothetical protein
MAPEAGNNPCSNDSIWEKKKQNSLSVTNSFTLRLAFCNYHKIATNGHTENGAGITHNHLIHCQTWN